MDLIYTHSSGGSLWQGGNLDVKNNHNLFHVVVLMAEEYQPTLPRRVATVYAGIDDTETMHPELLKKTCKIADMTSDIIADAVSTGKNVLSSCWMGWNRSGLVSGLTLVKLGYDPKDAIAVVQLARQNALSNSLFKKIILSVK